MPLSSQKKHINDRVTPGKWEPTAAHPFLVNFTSPDQNAVYDSPTSSMNMKSGDKVRSPIHGVDLASKMELFNVDMTNYMSERTANNLNNYASEVPPLKKDTVIMATIRDLGLDPAFFFPDRSKSNPVF
jgi:hypothetical protein